MWLLYLLACTCSPPDRLERLDGPAPVEAFDPSRPNVVVIVACTLRRDEVEAYGGPVGSMPFLTELAEAGVLFSDPIAAAPWTRASAAALFTGRHALELGMVEEEQGRSDRGLPASVATLAERFHDAGYRTVGATANPNLHSTFGFEQGYQFYLQPKQLWRDDRSKVLVDELLDGVVPAIGRAGERPLFLSMVLVEAHAPFAGPWTPSPDLPEEVARYRGALVHLDGALRRVHGLLTSQGYTAANTHFLVVSDHGEGLEWPVHHGISHGRYLYSSAIQAVWVQQGPGLRAGTVVEGVVSGVDLVPTLSGLAGLPGQAPGVDLSAAMRGTGRSPRTHAFSDTWYDAANRAAVVTDGTVCMRSFAAGPEAGSATGHFVQGCYDRRLDPLQEQVLAEPDPGLMQMLIDWRTAHQRPASTPPSVSPGVAEQLKELGYTE